MAAKSKEPTKDSDYPNIIEEPIRVVGDRTRDKSKADKSSKQPTKKSGKTVAKKSGKEVVSPDRISTKGLSVHEGFAQKSLGDEIQASPR